jgi:hypothetical protein
MTRLRAGTVVSFKDLKLKEKKWIVYEMLSKVKRRDQ